MEFKEQQLNVQIKEKLEKVHLQRLCTLSKTCQTMLQVDTITYLMLTDNILIIWAHCLHWEQRKNRRHVFKRL